MKVETGLKRDIAIEAAIYALIRIRNPAITNHDIQKESRTEAGTGYWTAIFAGDPIATVHIEEKNRFTITLAP